MLTKTFKNLIINYNIIPTRQGVHSTRVLQPNSRVAKNLCRNRVRYLRRVNTKF